MKNNSYASEQMLRAVSVFDLTELESRGEKR
jgi:hypothetical protein